MRSSYSPAANAVLRSQPHVAHDSRTFKRKILQRNYLPRRLWAGIAT